MDRFDAIRELGSGSYGRALLVRQRATNQLLVIKQMRLPDSTVAAAINGATDGSSSSSILPHHNHHHHINLYPSPPTISSDNNNNNNNAHYYENWSKPANNDNNNQPLPISSEDTKIAEMAYREVQLLISLNHPNIVKAYEYFQDGLYLNLVMEYCECGDLNQAILRQNGMLFAESQIRNWFSQLIFAVKYLHDRKILHRDLKAANIFLVSERRVIKLGDFGIAKMLDFTGALAYTQIGTPTSVSPEVCDGVPYGEKAEVWSLGVVLYQLSSLILPFVENNLMALFNAIKEKQPPPVPQQYSVELRQLLDRMLAKEADYRPSINEIVADAFLSTAIAELVTRGAASSSSSPSPTTNNNNNNNNNNNISEHSPPTTVSSSSPSGSTTFSAVKVKNKAVDEALPTVLLNSGRQGPGEVIIVQQHDSSSSSKSGFDESLIARIRASNAVEDVFKEALIEIVRDEMLTASTLLSLSADDLKDLCPKKKGLQMAFSKLVEWLRLENCTDNRQVLKTAIEQNDCETIRRLAKTLSTWLIADDDDNKDGEMKEENIGDVVVEASTGSTALHSACKVGHGDALKLLLSLGASLHLRNIYGDMPLHVAAYGGRLLAVDILLRNKAPVDAVGQLGRTALHMAAASGYQNVVALLLQHGANTELVSSDQDMRQTPLLIASFYGHVGVVRLLLEKGAVPTATNSAGDSALHVAAVQNKLDVVKMLLDHKAATGGQLLLEMKGYRDRTPLQAAAAFGRADIGRLLLSKGANIRAKSDGYGETALHLASYYGHADVAKVIIDADPATVELKNDNDETPLARAAFNAQLGTVKLLLNRKASATVRDKHGRTPLQQAQIAVGSNSSSSSNAALIKEQAAAVVELLMQRRGNVIE